MFRFGFRRRRAPRTYHVSSPDGTTLTFELESRLPGQELLNRTLEECEASRDPDYFGLASYEEGSFVKWIVVNKPLKKQLSGKGPFQLHLRVQVYPLDYHALSQPASRRLLCMQLRRDLLENRFSCEEDKIVWMLGLAVQDEVGDYDRTVHDDDYLSHVQFMPRLTGSLEDKIHTQHKMNRGKPPSACREELLGGAQLEPEYGFISYQLQDGSRNPVTMTAAPSGVRVLRGMMATNHYLWHTIIKITHKSRRLSFTTSSEHLATNHTQFTCSSSSMAANVAYHLSLLRGNYTSTHTQRPSRLQRFFSSRRSVRVLKPLQRRHESAPSSNPLQRRSFAGEGIDPVNQTSLNGQHGAVATSRPQRSSLPSSPPPNLCTVEVEERSHTHSDFQHPEAHSRQLSGLSHHSPEQVSPLPPPPPPPSDTPTHPRQGSVISHHSTHSYHSQDITAELPNHYGNYNNQDAHTSPIRASSATAEVSPAGYSPSSSPAHRARAYSSDHMWQTQELPPSREGGGGGGYIHDLIPEEDGVACHSSRHRHHSMRTTPPRYHITQTLPELHVEPSKSSTFPREGSSLSQPERNTESVVDLLDEALEVLDEEEDQRKERERQRAIKPWKPQHRGRFRLSLQDSSYYDHKLYSSYRHFNRSRAFHGSKQSSSSTTHLNTAPDPSVDTVANAQLQESLVELSQTSDTAIDPHIRSFVFERSQAETGGATEL